jgi:hypothetical protein
MHGETGGSGVTSHPQEAQSWSTEVLVRMSDVGTGAVGLLPALHPRTSGRDVGRLSMFCPYCGLVGVGQGPPGH